MNFKRVDEIYPEYYVIKVNEFNDVAKDGLDEWIYFLKNAEIKRGFSAKGLKQAQEKLALMQMPEAQPRNYRAYLENLRDDASYALTVKMDMEEILEKATKEATEQGMQQGMHQKAIEIAKAALQNGATIDFIMSITGLSRQDIEAVVKWA